MIPYEKKNDVYITTRYEDFKRIGGNRIVNQLHVKRLIDSMQQKVLITPIIVNENMEIIDGQHRYEALSSLNLPIHFIICAGYGLPEVHRLNEKSNNWSLEDFLNGYTTFAAIDNRFSDYIKLGEFIAHNGIKPAMAIYLTGGDTTEFKNGYYRAKNIEGAQFFLNQLDDFATYFPDHYKTATFIKAFYAFSKSPKYSHDNMVKKMEYMSAELTPRNTIGQYLEILCDIYNTRLMDKNRIYFKGEKEIA